MTSRTAEGLGRGRRSRREIKNVKRALGRRGGHVNKTVLIYRENRQIEKQFNNFIMYSFHEARELLFSSYEDGILDEDEFSFLHEQFMQKNLPNFSSEVYDRSL